MSDLTLDDLESAPKFQALAPHDKRVVGQKWLEQSDHYQALGTQDRAHVSNVLFARYPDQAAPPGPSVASEGAPQPPITPTGGVPPAAAYAAVLASQLAPQMQAPNLLPRVAAARDVTDPAMLKANGLTPPNARRLTPNATPQTSTTGPKPPTFAPQTETMAAQFGKTHADAPWYQKLTQRLTNVSPDVRDQIVNDPKLALHPVTKAALLKEAWNRAGAGAGQIGPPGAFTTPTPQIKTGATKYTQGQKYDPDAPMKVLGTAAGKVGDVLAYPSAMVKAALYGGNVSFPGMYGGPVPLPGLHDIDVNPKNDTGMGRLDPRDWPAAEALAKSGYWDRVNALKGVNVGEMGKPSRVAARVAAAEKLGSVGKLGNAVADMAAGMTTDPVAWGAPGALAGKFGPLGGRAVSAFFATQQGVQAVQDARAGKGPEALISGIMAALAGVHAVSPHAIPQIAPEHGLSAGDIGALKLAQGRMDTRGPAPRDQSGTTPPPGEVKPPVPVAVGTRPDRSAPSTRHTEAATPPADAQPAVPTVQEPPRPAEVPPVNPQRQQPASAPVRPGDTFTHSDGGKYTVVTADRSGVHATGEGHDRFWTPAQFERETGLGVGTVTPNTAAVETPNKSVAGSNVVQPWALSPAIRAHVEAIMKASGDTEADHAQKYPSLFTRTLPQDYRAEGQEVIDGKPVQLGQKMSGTVGLHEAAHALDASMDNEFLATKKPTAKDVLWNMAERTPGREYDRYFDYPSPEATHSGDLIPKGHFRINSGGDAGELFVRTYSALAQDPHFAEARPDILKIVNDAARIHNFPTVEEARSLQTGKPTAPPPVTVQPPGVQTAGAGEGGGAKPTEAVSVPVVTPETSPAQGGLVSAISQPQASGQGPHAGEAGQNLPGGGEGVRPGVEGTPPPPTSAQAVRQEAPSPGTPPEAQAVKPPQTTGHVANLNLDRLQTGEDVKAQLADTVNGMAADIERARGGRISLAETQKAAKELGLTPTQIQAAVPGAGAAHITALRQLMVDSAERVRDATAKYRAAPNEENQAAFAKATQEHQVILQTLAGHTAEAGRTLSSMRILADAYRGPDVAAQADALFQPKADVREATTPRSRTWGATNKVFTADAAQAARARIKGTAGTLNSLANVPGLLKDVMTIGGFHLEAGARSFADWAKAMKADIGDHVNDADLQHVWANLRAEAVTRIQTKQVSDVFVDQLGHRLGRKGAADFVNAVAPDGDTALLHKLIGGEAMTQEEQRTVSQAYLDAMPGRKGAAASTGGAIKTVDDLVASAREEAATAKRAAQAPVREASVIQKDIDDLTSRIKNGDLSTRTPTANRPRTENLEVLSQQRDTLRAELAQAKARAAQLKQVQTRIDELNQQIKTGQFPTNTPTANRPLPEALEMATRERDALQKQRDTMKREAAKPTPEEAAQKQVQAKIDAANARIEELKQKVQTGDTSTPQRTPGPTSPELQRTQAERDAWQKQLDGMRQAATKAAKPTPTPEQLFDRNLNSRLGKAQADAFRAAVDPEIIKAVANGRDLTPEQKKALGRAYIDAQRPRASAQQQSVASQILTDAVKEAQAENDRVNGNSPEQRAARRVAQRLLVNQYGADADRVAARLATLDPNDHEAMNKLLMEEGRIPASSQLIALWKAGLLSSPRTLDKVLLAHGISLTADDLAKLPSSAMDAILSKVTKNPRTVTGGTPVDIAKAVYQSATQGVREAGMILLKGEEEAQRGTTIAGRAVAPIARIGETRDRLFGDVQTSNKLAQGYINLVTRAHAATYRPARLYAFTRALQQEARLTTMNEGLSGTARVQRVQELLNNPTDEMTTNAIVGAEQAVFLNDNAFTQWLGKTRAVAPNAVGRAGIDFLMPFSKVGSNIASRLVDYAVGGPVEGVRFAGDRLQGKPFDAAAQKRLVETLGRQSVGGALMTIGAIGASRGVITGFANADKSKRPGSVLIGGKWHQISGLAPVGVLPAIGATIVELAQRNKAGEAIAGPAVKAGVKAFEENPVLRATETAGGLTEQNPMKMVGSEVGTIVPQGIADLADQLDKYSRDPKTLRDYVVNRIPLARGTVPARMDWYNRGEPGTDALYDPTGANSGKPLTLPPAEVRQAQAAKAPPKPRKSSAAMSPEERKLQREMTPH